MPQPYPSRRNQLLRSLLGACLVGCSSAVSAQEGANLGLRGVGSVSLGVVAARVERDVTGLEVVGHVDLGHFSSRRIRLAGVAAFLRTLPYEEYVEQDDATFRDIFYDLSGHVQITFLTRAPERRVVPYVGFGLGVHALTSSFGSIPIDIRYNTNVFGLRATSGVRLRGGAGARRGMTLEAGAVLARNVSRATVGLSMDWLIYDLRR